MTHAPTPTLAGPFTDIEVSAELIARVSPTLPCGNPLCECRSNPSALFAYSEVDADRWVAGRFMPLAGVDELIAGFDEEGLDNMVATSILFGAPWRFFEDADVLDTLIDHQRSAYTDTPNWYFERPVGELRSVRAAINEVDPLPVYHLLKLSYFVGREIGGGRGPTP